VKQAFVHDMEEWKKAARTLLAQHIPPEKVLWNDAAQGGLFQETVEYAAQPSSFTVPKEFMPLASMVSCYRSTEKWHILYRTLWRLMHETKHLLKISTDDDVIALHRMAKEVGRDSHKMKAFVRFRAVEGEENRFVAWHEPSHLVVRRTAPFFMRRFTTMQWAILTPDESAYWDGETLSFGEGVPRSAAPSSDAMEELWKTFYRHIFNPARIKVQMMKSEMPMKYWHTMPETALIPSMLEEADARVKQMILDGGTRISEQE
jgi:uracil-DNA glycosylase